MLVGCAKGPACSPDPWIERAWPGCRFARSRPCTAAPPTNRFGTALVHGKACPPRGGRGRLSDTELAGIQSLSADQGSLTTGQSHTLPTSMQPF